MRLAPLLLITTLALAAPVRGDDLANNPVAQAARGLGAAGLAPGKTAQAPIAFRRQPRRLHVETFVATLSDDAAERAALKDALIQGLAGYEEQAVAQGHADDVAGALAFAVVMLHVTITNQELPDATFPALVGQLRAALDQPAVRAASDEQKQVFYEASLCQGLMALTLASASGPEAIEQVRTLARTWLEQLLGAPADRVAIGANGLTLRAAPAAKAGSGLTHGRPAGWQEEPGGWLVHRKREDRGVGMEVISAHVRLLPAVPAEGNMGDVLRATWRTAAPAALVERVSGMVYRRWVGDGLLAQFVVGVGREAGRDADTMCTLLLVDCGATWQPVIVAQTYERPDEAMKILTAQAGSLSFGESADMAEAFLATLRCPGAPRGRPIVDPAALAAHYHFGSGSALQWENVHTGSTTMEAVSYGGELNLRADGTYDYRFASASGVVGAQKFQGDEEKNGRWRLDGDLLLLARKNGSEMKYRVAGLTRFADGVQAAVLISRLSLPINAVTVTDPSDLYSTKKR
jgi:hypothetical protein